MATNKNPWEIHSEQMNFLYQLGKEWSSKKSTSVDMNGKITHSKKKK